MATQNPTGANAADTIQTIVLMTQLKPLSMPAVGSVSKYWNVQFSQNGSTRVTSVGPDSNTFTAVDGDMATRTRARAAGATFAAGNQFPISGAGFTVSINSVPTGPAQQQIYVVSMNRR